MNDTKKPLHEYRKREPTEEELALVTKMLADGESLRAMTRALGCGEGRVRRIRDMLQVQENAIKLRETEIIPRALADLANAVLQLEDHTKAMLEHLNKQDQHFRKLYKAVERRKLENAGLRQRLKNNREERALLVRRLRSRGIDVPRLGDEQ